MEKRLEVWITGWPINLIIYVYLKNYMSQLGQREYKLCRDIYHGDVPNWVHGIGLGSSVGTKKEKEVIQG